METVNLDLATMEGLNEEVQLTLRSLTESLASDTDKASLGITIELQRVKDTDSLMKLTYKVKPTYPAKSRQIVANTDLVGNLTIMASPTQRNIFQKEEAEANV